MMFKWILLWEFEADIIQAAVLTVKTLLLFRGLFGEQGQSLPFSASAASSQSEDGGRGGGGRGWRCPPRAHLAEGSVTPD